MIIDAIPVWALFIVTAALVVFTLEIGFRVGKRVRRRSTEERESPVSAIAGTILGLLSFMLAFTFSIASDRYDRKKSLVREEANVLRTVWHRSDFLQEPDRAKTKTLLREYLDHRIAFHESGNRETADPSLADSVHKQHEMWDIAVTNVRKDPFLNSDIGAMYVESVNQIADVHALRVNQGLQARIPSALWSVLYVLMFLGMIGLGYQTAIADSSRSRASFLLAFAFSLVIALIAALDYPMSRFVRVSHEPLVMLQREMKDTPDTTR